MAQTEFGKTRKRAKPGKLSARQKLFVDEYCTRLSKKDAAVAVGYAAGSAKRRGIELAANSTVASAIDDEFRRRAESLKVTHGLAVLHFYQSAMRAAEMGDESSFQRAWIQIGKLCGFYEEHNRQRSGTTDSLEVIKLKLREAGIDVDAIRSRAVTVEAVPIAEAK